MAGPITQLGTPTLGTRVAASPVVGTYGTGQVANKGDYLVAVAMVGDSTLVETITTPNGWSLLAQVGNVALNNTGCHSTISIFGLVAQGGDAAPSVAFTTTGTPSAVVTMFELQQVNNQNPVNVIGTEASGSSSATIASITVTANGPVGPAGTFGICGVTRERSSATSPDTWTPGAGWSNATTDSATSTRDHFYVDFTSPSPTPGSTPSDAGTVTSETVSFSAGALVIFNPAIVGPQGYPDGQDALAENALVLGQGILAANLW